MNCHSVRSEISIRWHFLRICLSLADEIGLLTNSDIPASKAFSSKIFSVNAVRQTITGFGGAQVEELSD